MQDLVVGGESTRRGLDPSDTQAAVECWERLLQAGADLIRARFDLGGVVYRALRAGGYVDGVVSGLAAHLTKVSGKTVSLQVLYESARLYQAFGGAYERIEQLRRQLSFPLRYSYLVRRCVPVVTQETAWNAEEWAYREEGELAALERVVVRIEERFAEDTRRREETGSAALNPVAVQSSGFVQACLQSPVLQQVSVSVLLGRLHETVGYLERHALPWSEVDEAQWRECVERLTRLRPAHQSSPVLKEGA